MRSSRCTSRSDTAAALRPLLLVAGLVALVLLAFAGGYGYHRDELYFLVAGRHLAWAYPDQGPVAPLLAHVMGLRYSPARSHGPAPPCRSAGRRDHAGHPVDLRGELAGRSRAQLIAASCAAVGSVVLVTGHQLSTSSIAWRR